MKPRDYPALEAFLAERGKLPFAWGRRANDCGAFAGGAVLAQTGCDPLRGLRWSNQRGALRLILQAGGLGPLVARILCEVAPALAQRGDVALALAGDGDEVLMVVEGQTLVGPDNRRAPRSAMLRAFSAQAAG